MIRFRNPGTSYTTQIQVFKEIYSQYSQFRSFDLDDMAQATAQGRLMTAYGYAGDAALALSNTENVSLNSTQMNVKMYAEVFRLLGWVSSAERGKSYPLCFTYIGDHIASTRDEDCLALYEQCVLGINNPQEIMRVKYTEQLRFLKTALLTMNELDGVVYKHELCYGPMCIDDIDDQQFREMILKLRRIRGSYDRYQAEYDRLCADLGVKDTLPDNCTRLPIAFMKACKWVESRASRTIFPPKSLECLFLTQHGIDVARSFSLYKDLRLHEFRSYPEQIQQALIRLGVYTMLETAGYDISSVNDTMQRDSLLCADILQGKKLLFSPYQTIDVHEVDAALGIERQHEQRNNTGAFNGTLQRPETLVHNLQLERDDEIDTYRDEEVDQFTHNVETLHSNGKNASRIVDDIFDAMIDATQTTFYPFIATLFRVIGFNCHASRAGDNGARWDAIIVDNEASIPIEIKSPTEEQHISLKAIRQALENKVVLLSRATHPTVPEITSLVVGYYLPNDRAEVTNLISDFKTTYGYSIGVMDLKTLLKIAVNRILNNNTVTPESLVRLEGFPNVDI